MFNVWYVSNHPMALNNQEGGSGLSLRFQVAGEIQQVGGESNS